MLDPLSMAAIGAGLGLAKSELVDRPRSERERRREAEIARWSPWTGMAANRPADADAVGNMMTGGMTGGLLGQGMAQTDRMNELMASQKALLDAQTGAVAAGAPMAYAPGTGMPPYAVGAPAAASPWLTMYRGY